MALGCVQARQETKEHEPWYGRQLEHVQGAGFATFDGYSERVLFHPKDCAEVPPVGDVVTAYVHRRRRDGKHQAFRVEKVDAAEEQGQRVDHVHATLLGTG